MSHQSDHYVFHCGTLEQWHLAGNHSKVNDFVQEFRTSSFGKRYSTELQKKLAKYYQKADQPKTMKGPMELEEMYSTAKQNNVVGDGKNQKKQLERLASSIKTTRGKHLVDTINHIKTNQKKGESESNSSVIDEGEIRQKKLEAKVKERRDKIQANVAKHDYTEERDLLESLHANYTQCIGGNISPISCAQSLVNVMVHFSKSFYPDKYSEKSRGLLTDHFLKSYKSLRDNHMSENGENETMKIAEYQLQVLMRIELESALHNGEEEVGDAWVEEVANMLRRAAFSSDPTFLPQFLKEVVLENYVYVLPKTVGRIYEELMTEPPEEYAYLFSCENSDKDDSMNQSNPFIAEPPAPMSLRSASSIGSCSNDPWSNKSGSRSRSLVSHSSFTDASLKRQIMIPQVKKPKVEKAKVRGARPVTRSSAKKRSARKKKII
ncbi:uncharacterized protein LOC106161673, partial [Lingula anatina]|uniref:Uncharacterized protein LOC106161673 n=1 Tax=Lingula anatina TaxID=7574 RepID=A0A2R2MKM3_LINAN